MTDATLDDLAARLRSAAAIATPGKWESHWVPFAIGRNGEHVIDDEQDEHIAIRLATQDAAYIALANPENVLALLDERTRLQEALDVAYVCSALAAHPICLAEIKRAALGTTEGATDE